ncbi:MAG: DNA internalization-related competence protein ComEC/Rec2 [Propionivibrio sp.]|nr:DNA internalization-related competence protein ComEC/Rec2 [Propionivibrio sp.]
MRLGILAFAAGILLLQQQAVLPPMLAVAGLLVAGVGGIWLGARSRSGWARAAVVLASAALGFCWAAWRAEVRLADELPAAWEVRDIEMVGVVAALPQRFERGERFLFDVEEVLTPGARVPRRIFLSWYHSWDELERVVERDVEDGEAKEDEANAAPRAMRPGERWRFTARLKRPHGGANPHGFDYEAWLLERGIRATGAIRARQEIARLDDFVWRPGYVIERLRDRVRERFLTELPDAPYTGVLIALSIGDQRSIPAALWQVFNRTGVTHLVSISGLHVTMIAALCGLLVGGLWRRSERLALWLPAQKAAVVAAWMAALLYALLAGFEVPAQRTLYMLSVVVLTLCSGRHLGASRTLLLALFTVLLADPWAVMATGFWLSFGAVAVLFFAGTGGLGETRAERRWYAGLKQWGATQWAVTLGSLPLLLLFFQQFSLVSPMANAVAVPVVSFLITPLALVYALLPWAPLLHLDHWLLSQLMTLLDWLAGWPVWQQPAPPLWATMMAVLGVVCLLLPRGFPGRWTGVYLLLPALFLPPPKPPAGEAWVDVLDVGQGLAVLVRTAEHVLLYDTGPLYSAEANAGQRVVVPFLRAVGVRQIDTLIVSHRDKDHSGGLGAVQAHGSIGRTLSSLPDLNGELCAAGQSWEWDGIRFAVLHPVADDYAAQPKKKKKANNLSCVVRVDSGHASLLLAGDIEAADERALLARSANTLRSDVLVVPHHGGRGSSTAEFTAAVAPQHAVFSVGYRNSFGHPRPDVLERYAASRLWRTDRDGALRIVLGKEAALSAWRSTRPRYWHDR